MLWFSLLASAITATNSQYTSALNGLLAMITSIREKKREFSAQDRMNGTAIVLVGVGCWGDELGRPAGATG